MKINKEIQYTQGKDGFIKHIIFEGKRYRTLLALVSDIRFQTKRIIIKELDEEIEYLENHIEKANKGIKINVERIESWIFQTRRIKGIMSKKEK